jgi:tetraacyldisaccharide 4'-kinase
LGRDVELAVFDGRGAGNGWRLPVGPLREPLARLLEVDAVICNGLVDSRLPAAIPRFDMQLGAGAFYRLNDPGQSCLAETFSGKKLFALAGIGDPGRFFRTLEALGLQFEAHPFPDHHAYTQSDLAFADGGILLLTEKDAVKCAQLKLGEAWVLPVEAELSSALIDHILEKLRGRQVA